MKTVSKRELILGIFLWLIFIWIHTFVRMASYETSKGIKGYIVPAIMTLVTTIFYYWCIVGIFDSIEENIKFNISCCMKFLGCIWFLMLLGFIYEILGSGFSIFKYVDIYIGDFKTSKKYLFDIYAVIIFPLFVEVVFKAMRKEKFHRKSTVLGSLQLVGITIGGCMSFSPLNNIWLVDLALINIITITIGTYKYVWDYEQIDKKKVTVLSMSYVLVWFIILGLHCEFDGNFYQYMYTGNWGEYKDSVQILIKNASFVGISPFLLDASTIHEFLYNRSNFIHQFLFYGGWGAVGVGLMFLVSLMGVLIKMLDIKKYRIKKHFLIYSAAIWVFFIRIFMGLLYAFAMIPYPVALPFAGTTGISTDTIMFALLIVCAYENYKIDKVSNCEVVEIKYFLNELDAYDVKDAKTGKSYIEDSFEDRVIVYGNEKSIPCTAIWLYSSKADYAAFETLNGKVFMLEYCNKIWKTLEDKELIQELFMEYTDSRLSEYVEDINFEED